MVVWLKNKSNGEPTTLGVVDSETMTTRTCWQLTNRRAKRQKAQNGKKEKKNRDRSAFGYEIWWSVGHLLRRKRRIGQDEEKKELRRDSPGVGWQQFSIFNFQLFFRPSLLEYSFNIFSSRIFFLKRIERKEATMIFFSFSRIRRRNSWPEKWPRLDHSLFYIYKAEPLCRCLSAWMTISHPTAKMWPSVTVG